MQLVIALNDAGPAFAQYCEMAKVAIHTAFQRTSLRPHVIYDGAENDFTDWLKRRHVPVLRWRSSLYNELIALGSKHQNKGFIGALPGIFLRTDLPLIAERFGLDEYVLYTDCDVMFVNEVADLLAPMRSKYFAVAPEGKLFEFRNMNSGVMWMHLPEMRKRHSEFLDFVRRCADELPDQGWDQGAYLRFYHSAGSDQLWDWLPTELNWKPHWEANPAARIIHFHGPKPFQQKYIASHFPELKHLTGGCYDELCAVWNGELKAASAT